MHDALMHMYHTEKLDMPEYFRDELNHNMMVTMSTIERFTKNKVDKFEVWNSPCPLPSTGECARLCNTFTRSSIFPPDPLLQCNVN